MPRFRVSFPQPVTYQAGHPTAARQITELVVSAPDADGARDHAIRVTQGTTTGVQVEAA